MKTYRVKKISSSDQKSVPWDSAIVLKDFSYPWDTESAPKTTFRALWDSDNLYFRYDVEDMNIYTHVVNNHKREVNQSDRIEIFFTLDDTLSTYYCLEMDPLGRIMDFKANYYRNMDYTWQWPGNKELDITASISDIGYKVEGQISLKSLKQLGLLKNGELKAGLYRANCIERVDDESNIKWISWVDPKTEEPDFHVPTSFGRLLLID